MSSGSSVLSMTPPNRARIERFILLHNPIFSSSRVSVRLVATRSGKTQRACGLHVAEVRTVALSTDFRGEYNRQLAVNSRQSAVGITPLLGALYRLTS